MGSDNMLTLMSTVLATAILAQPADPLALSGVVVGPAGKPVADVEVVLAAWNPADGSVPTLAHTMTDDQGTFQLQVAGQRLKEMGQNPFIWAYQPGRSLAVQEAVLTGKGALPTFRLTLAEPWERKLTILDSEGRPVTGARLAPVSYALNDVPRFSTPDDRLERLTVATGTDGVATLPYLPSTIDPLTIRVTASSIVPHQLSIPRRPGNDRITLKLGRPARLAGSVYQDSGQPAANASVEVWVENTYELRPVLGETRKAVVWPSLVRFDSGPVRTGADGSFLTPLELMTGSSYRIIIRPEGDPPVSSEWLTAATELTTVPPLRLRQHRKLAGLVLDRQGQPVAGARVFLLSGEAATRTDAQGRFLLEGALPDKTYTLVQAEGFRLQGWPAIPARQPQARKLTLVRTSQPHDRTMAPLPPPIPIEESRALALRVLEPYLQAALEKGDDTSKRESFRILSKIDPGRVLDLLEKRPLQRPGLDTTIRVDVATELLAANPAQAESIVTAMETPEDRAFGYLQLAEALPVAERDRKRGLLERATAQHRAAAGDGRRLLPQGRISRLGRIAQGWLNVGEIEKAGPLIREGLDLFAELPKAQRRSGYFLPIAARLETDRVLSLIGEVSNATLRRSGYVAVAESLASERPDQAERVFQLIDDSGRIAHENKTQVAVRLCRLMSKTDPERARRIIGGLKNTQARACAWALLAHGLADGDKPAARLALAESIKLIDHAGTAEQATAEHPVPLMFVAANPAASILPIVENVAPERLEEVFWKAVALMPKDDTARERGIADRRLAATAIFLARYDRQLADMFVNQATTNLSRSQVSNHWSVVRVWASVDPRGAAATIEALPPGGPSPMHATNVARAELATCLAEPIDERWKVIWNFSGVPVDGRRSP
jgi:hypothetical protein